MTEQFIKTAVEAVCGVTMAPGSEAILGTGQEGENWLVSMADLAQN